MGDRAAQIRAEWFVKCASVVLQARVPSRPPTAAAGKDRQNRWVRPRVPRARCRVPKRVFQKAETNAKTRLLVAKTRRPSVRSSTRLLPASVRLA